MTTRLKGKAKFFHDDIYLFTADYEFIARDAGDGRPTATGFFYLSEQDRRNENILKWVQGQSIIMQLDKAFEIANIKKEKLEVFSNPAPSFPFDGKCNLTPYLF